MKIKIKTFAHLKELCGFEEKELLVSEGITVSDILKMLAKNYECFHNSTNSLLCAINEEYCGLDKILSDNDILAIFPPVSGG